jgi:hypothetical protein
MPNHFPQKRREIQGATSKKRFSNFAGNSFEAGKRLSFECKSIPAYNYKREPPV